MKDNYVTITKKDGTIYKMIIIATFSKNNINYIIYSDLNRDNYYIGKYNDPDNIVIDTNLSNEELKMCNQVFEELQNEKD